MFDQIATSTLIDDIALRILLSVTTGAFWLVIILAIIRLFKIRNPNLKYFLLTIPLLKSLLALARSLPHFSDFKGVFIISAKLPNPGTFLPSIDWKSADSLYGSYFHPTTTISASTIVTILVASLIFSAWRMVGMVRFVRLINKSQEVGREENISLFDILDKLVEEYGISYPKVILLETSAAPFTIGLKNPIIALSTNLIDQLETSEMEAILRHETAHISRYDHLHHWLAVTIRDILFFNPVIHYLLPRLVFERERACDYRTTLKSKRRVLAKSLVKVAEIQAAQPASPLISLYAPQRFIPHTHFYFKERVKELLEPKMVHVMPGHIKRLLWPALMLALITLDIHLVTTVKRFILVLS